MLFAIQCNDKPDSLAVRQANRPAHLEYLNGLGDQLLFAGPFLDEQGNPEGSLLMVNVADKSTAEDIASNDPYALAGLFQSTSVRPWKWAINAPQGV